MCWRRMGWMSMKMGMIGIEKSEVRALKGVGCSCLVLD
jgi:hypothetical protein